MQYFDVYTDGFFFSILPVAPKNFTMILTISAKISILYPIKASENTRFPDAVRGILHCTKNEFFL